MNTRILMLVAVVCLLPLDAFAGTPKLSGTYAFSLNESCQISVGTHTYSILQQSGVATDSDGDNNWVTNNTAPVFDTTIDDGKISVTTATARFNPKIGTVVVSGFTDKGSILQAEGLSDPTMDDLAEKPFGGATAVNYSNTASTLTINGLTWNVAYGNIVSGVAKYVTFSGIETEKPSCAEQGTAVHQ